MAYISRFTSGGEIKNESPCQKSITDTLGNVNTAKRFA